MGIDKARKASNRSSGRDGGSFIALPWSVLDCPAYSLLSHPARSLLIEFARQYVRDNNGRLLASGRYLAKRGWKSSDVIQRAKRELLDAGFIYETVKGHRPNKASWYAITWQNLDKHSGYDAGAFERWRDVRSKYANSSGLKINKLIPPKGVEAIVITPSHGVIIPRPIPPAGSIRNAFEPTPTPPYGNHLDIPSTKDSSDHQVIDR